MLIDWSSEFDRWLDELERRAATGQAQAEEQLDIVTANSDTFKT